MMATKMDLEASEKPAALPWWKQWQAWPRKKLYIWLAAGVTCLAMLSLAIGLVVHFGIHHTTGAAAPAVADTGVAEPSAPPPINNAVTPGNFADPSYISDGGVHYAFATNKFRFNRPGQVHIQMATSHDFASWTATSHDALPDAGDWTTNAFVWAPDVVKLADDKYVMYYAAQKAGTNSDQLHCIGAAFATNVTGPYTPQAQPIVCPLDKGGAIDPEGFQDADGTRYLLWKVDGNSFDGGKNHTRPTPIMMQQLDTDGFTLVGQSVQMMDREKSDGPLVEAPALGRYERAGAPPLYVLFFSSNFFGNPTYNVKYATSENLRGPYTRANKTLLSTGNSHLIGPGGMDVGVSSTHVVFHAIDKGTSGGNLTRPMGTAEIRINGTTVTI